MSITPRHQPQQAHPRPDAAPPAEPESEPSAVDQAPASTPVPESAPSVTEEPPAVASLEEVDEVIQLCVDFLQELLRHMGLKTRVRTRVEVTDPDEAPLYLLNIEGEDLSILIGRRGETLDAVQHLVRLYVNRHTHAWPRIEVDVENYKQRRARTLERLAINMADRAVREGRTVVLEAMPARERRLIHLALRDRDDVTTQSIGEGENRKVTIIPT
ncbi:MAG: KH domain-containing protein [Caldilineae bacterium]|nr:MAG: KH domain-containing protein [Caldilineae bacterium]